MDTPVAIGDLSRKEIDAELQKGIDSLKKDRNYSVDEIDAIQYADSAEVAEISGKLLARNDSLYKDLSNFK